MTLPGHKRRVTSLAYSLDGLLIASGSDDGTVRIWDTRTGEETITPLRSDDAKLLSISIAPNGRSLVSGTDTGAVCIWSLLNGESIPRWLIGHTEAVVSVAYSPDSSLVASASRDTTVRIWRVETGESLSEHRGYTKPISTVSVSSDGKIAVLDSSDDRVNELRTCGLQAEPPYQFSPSGTSMVSVEGRSVCLWTRWDEAQWSSIRLGGHSDAICSAVFSPNSLYIASASDDGTIRIWDAGGVQADLQPQPEDNRHHQTSGMSLTGANIVSVLSDSAVCIWTPQTGERQRMSSQGHTGAVLAVSITSDGSVVASSSRDDTVRLWITQTGSAIGRPLNHRLPTTALSFSGNGQRLAAGSTEPVVRIWTSSKGREPPVSLLSCSESVSKIAFSLDGLFSVGATSRGSIFVWYVTTSQQLRTLSFPGGQNVHSIAFSPNNTRVIFGGDDMVSRVWDLRTWKMVFQLEGHTDSVRSVTYSPDGQFIATGSDDRSVRLWDAETGLPTALTYGHRGSVALVGFASDVTIVSGSSDGTISVWDLDAAHMLVPVNGKDGLAQLAAATLEDGWLTGPLGELLFWVPAEYRPYLQVPPHKFQSDRRRVFITPGNDGWSRGDTWTTCWCDVPSGVSGTM